MLDLLPLPSDGLVRFIFDESVIFWANLIDLCLQKSIGFVDLSEDLMPTSVIGSIFLSDFETLSQCYKKMLGFVSTKNATPSDQK
jgi:hypothetical protein